MNRNRAEVSTRWSAAGAAAVYNLRLPPKASGEDTGAGPAPGLFMRLTPDSRAPAKADPAARAGVVVVFGRRFAPVLALGCGCCCCWPMLALFGRSFAPVLALGRPM